MNVMATPSLAEQKLFWVTGPRGNELYMHGFANQKWVNMICAL